MNHAPSGGIGTCDGGVRGGLHEHEWRKQQVQNFWWFGGLYSLGMGESMGMGLGLPVSDAGLGFGGVCSEMGLDDGGSSRRVEKGEGKVVGDDLWCHWRRDAGHVQYQSFKHHNEEGGHCPVLPQCPGRSNERSSDHHQVHLPTSPWLPLQPTSTYHLFVHLRKEGLATSKYEKR